MTPQRQTRQQIERELAAQKRNWRSKANAEEFIERMERHLAEVRQSLDPAQFAKIEAKFRDFIAYIEKMRRRRRPGDGSVPAFVEPPRGPRPLSGGAAARLEFDS